MNAIDKIFKIKKPIIGMLHLDYLEGEKFQGIDIVVKKATKDIEALQDGGIDGILIENWKENSVGEFVSEETAKNFLEAALKLKEQINIPFGINVLNNDYKVAFSAAKSIGAAFIELDVFIDNVQSDFKNNINAIKRPFIINPKPENIWKYAKKIKADDIPLFVFTQPKHYIMLEKGKTIEESAKQAIAQGASALIVTKATGFAPTIDLIKRVKNIAGNTPVGIGSGFSAKNAKEFLQVVDFAIVGTSVKIHQKTDNPVEELEVKKLMKIVKKRWGTEVPDVSDK